MSVTIVTGNKYQTGLSYYVSNTGNNDNDGLTPATAWQTISKVNGSTFISGDSILFKKGDTWGETLIVPSSGSVGSPITFGAYGTGVNPIITGFTTITGWTDEGGGIYSKTLSVVSTLKMVTVDGVNTAMGRYPSADWLYFEDYNGTTNIIDNELTGSPDWTNATVVIRRNRWTVNSALITNHTTTTITYSGGYYTPWSVGYGYFIKNSMSTLTSLGDWFHNGTTFYMYFGAVDPTTKTVKVATLDRLIDINHSYISVTGIDLIGSSGMGIDIASELTNISITNCSIKNTGTFGIHGLDVDYVNVDYCTLTDINYSAIYLSGTASTYCKVRHNDLDNIYAIEGAGDTYSYGAIQVIGTNNLIEYNDLYNCGYNGISLFSCAGSIIRNNFIDRFCFLVDDGAGIYTDGGGSGNSTLQITDNIVLNGIGNKQGTSDIPNEDDSLQAYGIYLDDESDGVDILDNTIATVGNSAIYLHNTINTEVKRNTMYDSRLFHLFLSHNEGSYPDYDITGLDIQYNIFFSKLYSNLWGTKTQKAIEYYVDGTTTLTNPGTMNYNQFARPINAEPDLFVSRRIGTDAWPGIYYTLAEWQSMWTQDANSIVLLNTIATTDDLHFIYNKTMSNQTYSLSVEMHDAEGTAYSGSIILQPFKSLILIGDGTVQLI